MTDPKGDDCTYPNREKFFSNRFVRMMTKVCVAQDLGPAVAWLLTVIVHTEDAAHYRRAVTYWDDQLAALVGASSRKTLAANRTKAVEAGWLHYEPGGKGRIARYWVTIPEHAEGLDDAPTDEGDSIHLRSKNYTANAPHSSQKLPANAPHSSRNDTAKGAHSIPVPVPVPEERENSYAHEDPIFEELERALQIQADAETFLTPPGSHPSVEFTEAYPRKIKLGSVPSSFDAAVSKLVERGRTPVDAHRYLIEVAKEYSKSPAGQPGAPDVRPAPSKFLDDERWRDGASEWLKPNGDQPKPFKKHEPSNPDNIAALYESSERKVKNHVGSR